MVLNTKKQRDDYTAKDALGWGMTRRDGSGMGTAS